MPRRFALVRQTDPSGVSGTGVVAYGVQFNDSHVVVRWNSDFPSTSLWDSMADLLRVHGHQGATIVRWIDAEPTHIPHQRENGLADIPLDGRRRAPRSGQSRRAAGRHRAP